MNLSHLRNTRNPSPAQPKQQSGTRRRAFSPLGFSLSEIVVSIGIIGSAAATVLALIGTSLSQGGSARLNQEATLAARHVLGELLALVDSSQQGETPVSIADLSQRQWFFGPGLQPLDPSSADDALYRVTLDFPASPTPPAADSNQQAPGMNPLQPVELIVRHPWRGRETPDQREDRLITQLRL